MLQNSFVFLDRVGYRTEEKLWGQGVLCWEDFLDKCNIRGISSEVKKKHDREVEMAEFSLRNKISHYFSYRLKPRDYWRLYPEFKDDVCFLDIETTGLSPRNSDVTVVGISDGRRVRTLVKGISLTEEALVEELARYRLVVTFYGSAFDIPFLARKYPRVRLSVPHIDLCFAGRRIGLKGGLKAIERELGITRDEEIKDVEGLEAVRLWRQWEKHGDEGALERLLEYNRADVANLKALAETVYHGLRERTFVVEGE
jgi:hypothetical protein